MFTGILRLSHCRIRFTTFISDYCKTSEKSNALIRRYKWTALLISLFEKEKGVKIYTSSFDHDTIYQYVHFLENRYISKKKNKPLLRSTIIGYVDVLKTLLIIAKDMGYHVKLSGVKELRLNSEDSKAIYLPIEDIKRINDLKMNKNRSQVRDLFVIGCFTALRFSDYSSLNGSNFDLKNNQIHILTQKTKEPVIIPMHPIVREVIDRNGGYDFLRYDKSHFSFNKLLKKIMHDAGFTEKILIERTRGGKIIREEKFKYELISSHTARRSGATNMFLSGIPVFRIMLITGHATESSFFYYIRINKEENAKYLSEHPFFKE